ncbi:hypothetical protein A4R26_17200 [Niastella populi]|uniref:Uncharacterized protein n=1 Tax=Niastella populi TaxID=550983 RepID=A0A1V9FZC7_9BACT|nr:hypothetical protein A4R26_17200 [Niastella populi]
MSPFDDRKLSQYAVQQFNSKVDSKTVSGSVIGLLISTIIGAFLTGLQISLFGRFFYVSLILVYVASWITLRMITKKDAGNPIILLTAVLATIIGPGVTLWLFIR